jgi:hypothetical protein
MDVIGSFFCVVQELYLELGNVFVFCVERYGRVER